MLDARVKQAILDLDTGRSDLEQAAQRLLQVRRETGCLTLHATPGAPEPQRRLIERYTQLVQDEVGS